MNKKNNETIQKQTKDQVDDTKIIEELQQQVEDWKDKALRSLSEMENLKKRTQIDIEKSIKFANAKFAKELLPVIDCLNGALVCVPKEKAPLWDKLVVGIEMTLKQFQAVLKTQGIEKMECFGQIFDPHYQKVIQEVVDNEKPEGTIIQELQEGYTIGGDRVLREAMVIVTKKEKN